MKKNVSIILIISMLISLLFSANVFAKGETVTVDSITYTSYDTYCVVTGCDEEKSGDVIIPSSVKFNGNNLPVTSIGNWAFYYCKGFTSITIPDSVTEISCNAFRHCSGLELESITVSDNNKNYHSFGNCLIENESKTLILGCKNSVIPNDGSVTKIGDDAFYDCAGLKSVTIPDSVTEIGGGAFYGCSGLTSVTIPDSVTTVNDGAFHYCSGLTSITIPGNVTRIGSSAFSGCGGLESITVSKNNKKYRSSGNCLIETESKTLIAGCKNSVIPDDGSVNTIGGGAFAYCEGITDLIIPYGTVLIMEEAFRNCTGLQSVTLPDSVKKINYYAFDGCCNIEKVNYGGSQEQWNRLCYKSNIGKNNDYLINAQIICAVSGEVEAETEYDIEYEEGKLYILIGGAKGERTSAPGEEIYVKIKLRNNPGICSLRMDINYGDQLSVLTKQDLVNGEEVPDVGYNVDNLTVSDYPDEHILILNYLDTRDMHDDLMFAEIKFKVSSDAEPGSFLPITASIRSDDVFDLDFNDIPFELVTGGITVVEGLAEESVTDSEESVTDPEESVTDPEESVTDPEESVTDPEETVTELEETATDPEETATEPEEHKKGDCNGDGTLDNKDVVTLFRFVSSGSSEYNAMYDFNGDNEVNNKDVVELFRFVSTAK